MKEIQIIGIIVVVVILAVISLLKFKKNPDSITLRESVIKYSLDDDDIVTKETMKSLFSNYGLGKHWDKFEPRLRDELRILTKIADESNLSIGQSKIGGHPDLPENIDWFTEDNGKSLSFIAQINFKELKAFNKTLDIPDSGIVYFFYSAEQEAWGFDNKDKDKFKVFYTKSTNNLKRRDIPADLEEHSVFQACGLTFNLSVSLPSWENEFVSKHLSDKEIDNYMDLTSFDDLNKMFGYAANIQGEMELECQLVTNGLYCGDPTGYNDPKAAELEKGVNDWKLLLQIDSEMDKTGMMWGDAGRLYFWIKQQDLEKLDFEKAWFVLQCY